VTDSDINWEDLCAMALTHQLSAIVNYQLSRDAKTEKFMSRWEYSGPCGRTI